jgi:hypothetical protein
MEGVNTHKHVQIVEKQNETKKKLRRAFTRIDEGTYFMIYKLLFIEKQGTVK